MRWEGSCSAQGRSQMHTRFWLENLKWKDHSEDLWRMWEDHIKMDHRETGFKGVDYIHLSQDWGRWLALANTVMNLWIP
jgi:hypothetical protein